MKLNLKALTPKDIDSFDVIARVQSMSRNKQIALGGAAVGMAKTATDDTDDNLGSTAAKSAVGAGIALGGYHGAKYALDKFEYGSVSEIVEKAQQKLGQAKKEIQHATSEGQATKIAQNADNKGSVKTGDVSKIDVEVKHDSALKDQATKKKMNNWLGKAKLAGAIGLGAFAVASVMDTSETLAEKKRTTRMTEEQERNLNRKISREERNQKQHAYGHVDFGQMAIDLFNERTGHHKMGNAKFQ